MRIMLHTNSPQSLTGYGTQARLLGTKLIADGHQVAVSAFNAPSGAPAEWNGMTILGQGQLAFGVDVIVPHAVHYGADLVVTLMDFWQLGNIAEQLQTMKVAAWLPVDCSPLGFMDRGVLQFSKALPIAMSRFGLNELTKAGYLSAPYIPHAVDTTGYRPLEPEQRVAYRAGMGLGEKFVIGVVAANNDHLRKGFPEQFEAFRRFHKSRPDAMLLVHTIAQCGRGLDLPRMAQQMGLEEGSYRFSDTYAQQSGIFDDQMLADFYGVCDVLSQCSYGEGFGVPMIEAQACGTPVISTRGSTMDELRGPGWGVAGQPFWNFLHGAWWQRPDIAGIVRAYEKAYTYASTKRAAAREFALDYDIERVYDLHWRPFLDQVAAELAKEAKAGGVPA